ncbi:MAG: hypothetical protein L6W00_01905 [Lentisphaeria bacterium]|nr:MAG: hypothetical protein L6W00_01905 [Lentisphaeria bacterium]
MKLNYSQTDAAARRYVPVALGNGDLSFQIDGGGAMEQREYCGMTPDVVRAGIRYDFPQFPLISFGSFQQELPGTPAIAGFLQEFDPETGLCRCRTDYADGSRLDTTVFCHLRLNLIVIRKSGPPRKIHGSASSTGSRHPACGCGPPGRRWSMRWRVFSRFRGRSPFIRKTVSNSSRPQTGGESPSTLRQENSRSRSPSTTKRGTQRRPGRRRSWSNPPAGPGRNFTGSPACPA